MNEYSVENVPEPAFYANGLIALADRVTDLRRNLLTSQYYAPNRRVTAPQLAALAGVSGGYPTVNAQYGGLGRAFCESTGFQPDIRPDATARWWSTWSEGHDDPIGFIWEMHDSVATALELLEWVDPTVAQPLPEEIEYNVRQYNEGSLIQIAVNTYERNSAARLACLEHYGYDCTICGFNFVNAYGTVGESYIDVHHLIPLAEIGREYVVDSIADLRPVCPNCHAMIHRTNPMMTINDLKRLVNHSQGHNGT